MEAYLTVSSDFHEEVIGILKSLSVEIVKQEVQVQGHYYITVKTSLHNLGVLQESYKILWKPTLKRVQ